MPHHKSAVKRVRTDAKKRERNYMGRSLIRLAVKNVRSAKAKEEGETALKIAVSELDRGAKRGIIKGGKASRTKSRLAHHVAQLSA